MTPSLNLTIAHAQLQFRGTDGLRVAPVGFEYPPFLGEHAFDRSLAIDVSIAETPAPAADRLLFDTADGWLLTQRDGMRCLRMPVRGADGSYGERDLWRISWQEPLQHAHAQVHRDLVGNGVVRHIAQYPLDQILLTTLLAAEGALLVHACGGVTSAGGIAFAGVSGAGKSTLTRLLDDTAGTRFFSDDRLFIRRAATPDSVNDPKADNGAYWLYGTPWAGDARAARNERTSLNAMCFLTQANSTRLCELQPAQALERLLAVTTLPWFDAEAIGRALDACAALIESVPCYELLFHRDRKAIEQVLGGLRDA